MKLERSHALRIGALIQAYDSATASDNPFRDVHLAMAGLQDAILDAVGLNVPVANKGRYFMVVQDLSMAQPGETLVIDQLTEV